MKHMKHWLMTAALLLCSVVVSAEDFSVDGIYYNITSETNLTVEVTYQGTGYSSIDEYSGDVTIPAIVKHDGKTYRVTTIGMYAFYGCKNLISVVIPSSVTTINDLAFTSCSGLKSIHIPNSVIEIKQRAFQYCSSLSSLTLPEKLSNVAYELCMGCSKLESIVIPEGATYIGEGAFRGCSKLQSANFPESLTIIGKYAFWGSDLETPIHIPANVTKIEGSAFAGCSKVTSLTFSEGITWIGGGAFAGLGISSLSLPGSLTVIDRGAFSGCPNLESVTFHESYRELLLLPDVFNSCAKITTIAIPEGVTRAYLDVCSNCPNLMSLELPSSVTEILGAFIGNQKLRSFTVKCEPPTIASHPFASGVNKDVCILRVPSESLEAYQSADYWKEFKNIVTIENTVDLGACGDKLTWMLTDKNELIIGGTGTMTDYESFADTPWSRYQDDITQVTIGEGVVSIGKSAFGGCNNLTSINIPANVTSVGESALAYCGNLKSIVVAEDNLVYDSRNGCNAIVETWTNVLAAGCSTTTIPEDVVSIANSAFEGCKTLTDVVIPESVTEIGMHAFADCSGLTSITCNAVNPPVCGDNAFDNVDKSIPVYVPSASAYKAVDGWKEFGNMQSTSEEEISGICGENLTWKLTEENELIVEGTGAMTDYANEADVPWYEYRESITVITIGNEVNAIGTKAFSGCTNLLSVTVPKSVVSIGKDAFMNCTGGELVVNCNIPSDPKNGAFLGSKFASVTIGDGVVSIGDCAFYNCNSITSITIPESVTEIGFCAFEGCSSIASVNLPENMTSIGDRAFHGCSALSSIVIPEGVTSIGWGTFRDCNALTSVTIPAGVTVIGEDAFGFCTNLTSIILPASVNSIGSYAFCGCSDLTAINIPMRVTEIKNSTFVNCSSLTTIIIPENVANIGKHAFDGCYGLTSITCNAVNPPACGDNAFDHVGKSIPLYVPSVSAYKVSDGWNEFVNMLSTAGDVLATSLSLDKTEVVLTLAESVALVATLLPEDVTNSDLRWNSSDESVVIVDANGVVTAIADGEAVIMVSTTDGSDLLATCVVTVETKEAGGDVTDYDNMIYFEDATAFVNTTIDLPLQLKNENDITAVQFDVYLPDGVTIEKTSRGKYNITFNEDRADNSTHTLSSALQADGAVRVLCYSTDSELFWGNEGAIFNFPLEVSEMEEGDYSIIIKNIILTEQSGKKFEISSMTSTLNVLAVALGDCNRDNAVDVADIVTLANHILNNPVELFVEKAADFNKDNAVDVADIVAIANFILGGNTTAARALTREVLLSRALSAEYSFDILPFVLEAEGTKTISLDLADPTESFTAFQCDLYLPEGISINKNKRGKYELSFNEERTDASYHTLSGSLQADGAVRMLCYSTDSEVFLGTDGALINIPLTADAALKSGVYEFSIANTVLTYQNGTKVEPVTYKGSIIVGDGGEVESMKLYGKYTAGVLEDFSASLSTNKSITSIDLTDAVSVAESGTLAAGNPNMLVYLSENATLANENNVVCGDECSSLQLTDGYAFDAPVAFTAQQASYTRVLTAGMYGTILLPFAPNVEEYVFCALTEANDNSLTFDEVAQPEANTAYLYTLRDGLSAAAITASNVQIESAAAVAEADGWKMIGAYVGEKIDCTTVSDTYYYVYSSENHELNRVTKMLTVKPFRAYLTSSSAINKVKVRTRGGNETVIGTREIDSMPSVYYDLSGRQVVQPTKGIYIVNGKKIVL